MVLRTPEDERGWLKLIRKLIVGKNRNFYYRGISINGDTPDNVSGWLACTGALGQWILRTISSSSLGEVCRKDYISLVVTTQRHPWNMPMYKVTII